MIHPSRTAINRKTMNPPISGQYMGRSYSR